MHSRGGVSIGSKCANLMSQVRTSNTDMSIEFLHISPADVFCSLSIPTSKWLVYLNKSIAINCVRVCFADVLCSISIRTSKWLVYPNKSIVIYYVRVCKVWQYLDVTYSSRHQILIFCNYCTTNQQKTVDNFDIGLGCLLLGRHCFWYSHPFEHH